MSEFPATLRSAPIIASGCCVSSTAPASARNSRLRDSAMRSTTASPRAIASSASPIGNSTTLPPSRRSEDEVRNRTRPVPRSTISATRLMMPAKIAAITPSRASPLRTCVSSCASTAVSSRSSSVSISPCVTVTEPWSRRIPAAKAFSAGNSITAKRGIDSPRAMQSVSSAFHSRGSSLRVTGCAPLAQSIRRSLKRQAMPNQPAATIRARPKNQGRLPSAARSPAPKPRASLLPNISDRPKASTASSTGKPASSSADFQKLFQM
jgi:hypothetical protein